MLRCLLALLVLPLAAVGAQDARDQAIALQDHGFFYSLRGDRKKTDDYYRQAIATDPKGKGYRLSYGWALYNLGDYEAALATWRDAFTGVDREYINRAVCLAMVHEKLGHPELAVEWYQVQCLASTDFASLQGLREFTVKWQSGEQKVSEEIYHRWSKQRDAAEKWRARVRPKARTWEQYEAQTPGATPLAFQLQQRLDESFADEVRKTRAFVRPEKTFVLPVSVHPDGRVGLSARQSEDAAFAEPLSTILAIHALQALAEKPVAFPASQTAPLTIPARFEIAVAAP
jgi:hypothetical protein